MNLYVRIMMTEIIHKFRYPVNADAGAGSKADIARSQSIDRCDFSLKCWWLCITAYARGRRLVPLSVSSIPCVFL